MEAALVLVRLGQYVGAAGLFGGALFLARQPHEGAAPAERRLLLGSALLLLLCTALALIVQAAAMTGAANPFADLSMVGMVVGSTSFGYAVVARLGLTLLATIALLITRRSQALWATAALGAGATLSLAWGGHGAGDEGLQGAIHLGADLLHLLAAALWVGALGALVFLVLDTRVTRDAAVSSRLHAALAGFSGWGTLAVGLLVVTGVANSWFLVGPTHLGSLFTTLYGCLLLAKLGLFAAMAVLAGVNRWRLTPALNASGVVDLAPAVAALRRSLALESVAGVLVLLAVAWLGTLAPPAAG